jgi:hypothetical protein
MERNLMAQGRSPLFGKPTRRAAGLAVALAILAAPSFAQDAGVSGIPQGPGNINGLNNSGRDPSGIGNASRVAPLPQPDLRPVPVPSAAPLYSTQPSVRSSRVVTPNWSHLSPRARHKAERAAVKENDRLLSHGVTSICRGC